MSQCRKRAHHAGAVVDEHRAVVGGNVYYVRFALCEKCRMVLLRVERYGPGSNGDSGWTVAP